MRVKHIVLKTESGHWLADVVLTDDNCFFCYSDWGNWNYKWGSSSTDFIEFLKSINQSYFLSKIKQGISYISNTRAVYAAADRFVINVFPALQEALKKDSNWPIESIYQPKPDANDQKICYKTNQPCKYDCDGLCKESC